MRKIIWAGLIMFFILFNYKLCQAPNSEFGKILQILYAKFEKYNIDYKDQNFLLALIKDESNFKNLITCEKKYNEFSYGVFQILYYTAKNEFGVKNRIWLEKPENNIELGIRFFKILKKTYDGDYYKICSHWKTGKRHNKKYYVRILKFKNMLERRNREKL